MNSQNKQKDLISRNITVIGGGTGLYYLLRGLKRKFTSDSLSAVVSVMDSGGSTGRLKDEFGYLPAGDMRRCLLALSEDTTFLRKLFSYRFKKGTGLAGHNLGNLFLTALTDLKGGSDYKAVKEAGRILQLRGRVYPVTLEKTDLCAELEDGQLILGETNIDVRKHDDERDIDRVFLSPEAEVFEEAENTIMNSEVIILGPGDLYTSIIPNLLVEGVSEAIKESSAEKVYLTNIMTKKGETDGFTAGDFVNEIEKYLGEGVLDHVLVNSEKPSEEQLEEYKKEGAEFVEPKLEEKSYKVTKKDLISYDNFARHDPEKLGEAITDLTG